MHYFQLIPADVQHIISLMLMPLAERLNFNHPAEVTYHNIERSARLAMKDDYRSLARAIQAYAGLIYSDETVHPLRLFEWLHGVSLDVAPGFQLEDFTYKLTGLYCPRNFLGEITQLVEWGFAEKYLSWFHQFKAWVEENPTAKLVWQDVLITRQYFNTLVPHSIHLLVYPDQISNAMLIFLHQNQFNQFRLRSRFLLARDCPELYQRYVNPSFIGMINQDEGKSPRIVRHFGRRHPTLSSEDFWHFISSPSYKCHLDLTAEFLGKVDYSVVWSPHLAEQFLWGWKQGLRSMAGREDLLKMHLEFFDGCWPVLVSQLGDRDLFRLIGRSLHYPEVRSLPVSVIGFLYERLFRLTYRPADMHSILAQLTATNSYSAMVLEQLRELIHAALDEDEIRPTTWLKANFLAK